MNCLLLPESAFTPSYPDPLLESDSHLADDTKAHAYCQAKITDTQQLAHIKDVLGAKVGDTLKIGQKNGNLGSGVIGSIRAGSITLVDVALNTAPPSKLELTIVLAVPRPKVLRRLIMDMTALGVKHIILVNSYRSQKSYWQSPLLQRLDEFVVEGLQQACDTVAPSITLKKRFKPFVEDELAEHCKAGKAIVAHPYAPLSLRDYLSSIEGTALTKSHRSLALEARLEDDQESCQQPVKRALPTLICIGAEGGWIDYEVELLQAQGCQPVSMGARILRTEAAVNALIGQWLV